MFQPLVDGTKLVAHLVGLSGWAWKLTARHAADFPRAVRAISGIHARGGQRDSADGERDALRHPWAISSAFRARSRNCKACSPMPIQDDVEIRPRPFAPCLRPVRAHSAQKSRRAAIITWPTISPAVRFAQPVSACRCGRRNRSACSPTWLEMPQRPANRPRGCRTTSTSWPPAMRTRYFRRPVGRDVRRQHSTSGTSITNSSFQIGAVGLAQVSSFGDRKVAARPQDDRSTCQDLRHATSWPAFSGVPAATRGLAHRGHGSAPIRFERGPRGPLRGMVQGTSWRVWSAEADMGRRPFGRVDDHHIAPHAADAKGRAGARSSCRKRASAYLDQRR